MRTLLLTIAILLLVPVSGAAPTDTPDIRGTYRLVSRAYADGKVLRSPEIDGLMSISSTTINTNLITRTPTGETHSYSSGATYQFTATEFTETRLFVVATWEKVTE